MTVKETIDKVVSRGADKIGVYDLRTKMYVKPQDVWSVEVKKIHLSILSPSQIVKAAILVYIPKER